MNIDWSPFFAGALVGVILLILRGLEHRYFPGSTK